MITININELVKENEQLVMQNEILRKRILSMILSDNTEITRLNFKVEQLEKKIKRLVTENARLSLYVK